ncbi:3'-5' exonuclease [Sulfurovum sp.]|jgi:DNA polymerase-3 subunit epsilon|uniref:3'-5' exonuclease n=1 Tax=Sulfurovum sp. TaxID=1969726 RepID=UPI0025EEB72B|nr:3'-5' exonuclease [Sulfurovum sp.]
MFGALRNKWNRKGLKDERFDFLFMDDNSGEVVVFDCETTGLNPKKDEIISIGAVKIKDNRILTNESIHIYIKQEKQISHESITIHKIRHCDLEHAVTIEKAIEKFLHFIEGRTLAGYYLEFDVAMINKYTKRMYGITLPNKQEEVSAIYYDKKIPTIPQGNIDLRFETIIEDLALPKLQAHDALNDAVMTAMIYLKLKNTKSLRRT